MKTFRWVQIVAGASVMLGTMAVPAMAEVSVGIGVGGGYPYYGHRYYGPHRYYGDRYHHGYGYGGYGGYGYGGSVVVVPEPRVVERAPYSDFEIVRDVQAELRRRGFYNGSVDGVMGPRTRDALATYQSRRGLPVTGRIDRPTLDALRID